MKLDFINPLIERGFIECAACGKIVRVEHAIKGLCPTCYQKQNK